MVIIIIMEVSTTDVVLRKSRKSLLSSRISIPRVESYQCDKCGHKTGRLSYHEAYGRNAWEKSRSISLYLDKYSYLNFEPNEHVSSSIISHLSKIETNITKYVLFRKMTDKQREKFTEASLSYGQMYQRMKQGK